MGEVFLSHCKWIFVHALEQTRSLPSAVYHCGIYNKQITVTSIFRLCAVRLISTKPDTFQYMYVPVLLGLKTLFDLGQRSDFDEELFV